MKLETQTSSKARVKNDTFGDDGFKALFVAYEVEDLNVFRTTCETFIRNSGAKESTKESFINELSKIKSKGKMLQSVTNYMLAGEGRRV